VGVEVCIEGVQADPDDTDDEEETAAAAFSYSEEITESFR